MTMRPISPRGPVTPFALATAFGVVLWLATSLLTGRREAWDASVYWTVAYPLAIVACAAIGYAFPDRPWRAVLALFAAQFVAMCLRNGELGGLWPLGLALFAALALPGVVAAHLAARTRRRRGEGTAG